MSQPCDVCKSTGLIDREDKSTLAQTQPILAQHQTVCWKCGGSGSYNPTRKQIAEAANKAAGLVVQPQLVYDDFCD